VLIDARTVADGEVVEADVCVAGGGVAGLVTALELEEAGVRVALVEGGESLEEGEVEGDYPPLSSTRAGGLGGTAALWSAELAPGQVGARYAPLAAVDFEAREGIPWSGWPFGRAHLEPFYARARELCRAGPLDDEAAPRNGDVADVAFGHGPREVFTRECSERVARSDSVRVFVGGTAVDVERAGDAVSALRVATGAGRSFSVRARDFVLALGGVENARFLLLAGLGNAHDLVGRFFMDHPTARCRLDPSPDALPRLGAYDIRRVNGHVGVTAFGLSEATLRREGLPNSGFFVVPAAGARSLGDLAAAAHRRVARAVPRLAATTRLTARSALLNTLGVGAVSGWSQLRRPPSAFDAYHVLELWPERERRVELGSRRDELGRPVARLRWFVSDGELEAHERAEELVAAALDSAGLGRLTTARQVGDELHPTAHHHLGTTRMADDQRRGVVDADGRVHGVPNLYVTGGSVFPTGGYVNPTLTIVALAARLAAHLREKAAR
jgi:choline dehydrogenase-like flavoprotein